jgi:hypothetical protein
MSEVPSCLNLFCLHSCPMCSSREHQAPARQPVPNVLLLLLPVSPFSCVRVCLRCVYGRINSLSLSRSRRFSLWLQRTHIQHILKSILLANTCSRFYTHAHATHTHACRVYARKCERISERKESPRRKARGRRT